MHINRLRPQPGEEPAVFLLGVVWDAIRDAKAAGLTDVEAHILLSGIARSCDPAGANRVWARPATRDELLGLVAHAGPIGWDAALALTEPSSHPHVEKLRLAATARCNEHLARQRR